VNIKRFVAVASLAAAVSLGTAVGAEPADSGTSDVSIPFANHGGIRDWQADSDRGLWLQDSRGKWYYATVMTPCLGLNFAETIAFDTHPAGSFDRFSSIIVPGSGRCVVQTLRASGKPPSKHDKVKAVKEPVEKPSAEKPQG
jgi:hypothetical protein